MAITGLSILYILGALMTYHVWWETVEHIPASERPRISHQNVVCIMVWPLTASYLVYYHLFIRPKNDRLQTMAFEEFKENVKKEIDAALAERYEDNKSDGNLRLH